MACDVPNLIDPSQLVFPFLADDPSYQKNLLREEITREVERRISPRVIAQLSKDLNANCYRLIEEVADEAVSRAMRPLGRKLDKLNSQLRSRRDDPADWWKKGSNDDRDDEAPF